MVGTKETELGRVDRKRRMEATVRRIGKVDEAKILPLLLSASMSITGGEVARELSQLKMVGSLKYSS